MAANYDVSSVIPQKSLRRQNGKIYDDKKIGNNDVNHKPQILTLWDSRCWPAAPKPGGGGPERQLGGNAIDFCVQVLRLSFHDAMRELTGP